MVTFIVIYRQHGDLNIATRHIGPFTDYEKAEEQLESLPVLDQGYESVDCRGCRYITSLESPSV